MKTTKNKMLILSAAAVAAASLAITGCAKTENKTNEANQTGAIVKYTCEMHPEVVQDKPGECPKCHMKLTVKR